MRTEDLTTLCHRAALIATLLLAACEPEDPKIRQELAGLRTREAELEKEVARLGAELADAKRHAAPRAQFLERAELKRRLDAQMSQLRAVLAKAFPDYRVDPVNAGTINTPLDEEAVIYTSELTFGLSKGGRISNHTVLIAADRGGNWQVPSPEHLAAVAGQLAASGATQERRQPQQQVSSGRGALNPGGPRVIEWPDQQQAGGTAPVAPQTYAPSQTQMPAAAPTGSRQSAPGGNAPFPVQDSRTIQFE